MDILLGIPRRAGVRIDQATYDCIPSPEAEGEGEGVCVGGGEGGWAKAMDNEPVDNFIYLFVDIKPLWFMKRSPSSACSAGSW